MPQVNLRFPTGRESNLIQTPLHGYCARLKLSMHGRLYSGRVAPISDVAGAREGLKQYFHPEGFRVQKRHVDRYKSLVQVTVKLVFAGQVSLRWARYPRQHIGTLPFQAAPASSRPESTGGPHNSTLAQVIQASWACLYTQMIVYFELFCRIKSPFEGLITASTIKANLRWSTRERGVLFPPSHFHAVEAACTVVLPHAAALSDPRSIAFTTNTTSPLALIRSLVVSQQGTVVALSGQ
ncbi:hypothetical protein GGX14DRAFT_391840 [Mycena pura]|uniref:Uncharacterized protein n=1 Tax=Mycena pura TaxID=153505 RepID=A0AAD6VNS0_9AGAR|nr:hypothetical protein GGX14DRAFT_391840 [Mycena pura]